MNYPQRMYSKTELGLPYFPDTTDGATARRHIMGLSVVSPSGTSCNV